MKIGNKKGVSRFFVKNKKGDIELDLLGWLILGLVLLTIGVLGYFILSGKGSNAIEYIKNLLRFRR